MNNIAKAIVPPFASTALAFSCISAWSQNALEEVVVTAQKRTQTIEDVPISISVVSGKRIEDANLNSANQLAELVPGLRIDAAGGFSQPTIRGVGSSISQVGASSIVATYVDGFYIASQLTTDAQLANLENVQVLTGPQGTLFGRNATGGAILIKTRDPAFETSGNIKLSYARFDSQRHQGYFTTGLSDSVAMNISGFYDESDGFLKNITDGDDTIGK
ncbi:MAG: TonB-dependent receptor [Parahaliea sp.]